jgi:hypothetical protein
MKPALTVPLIIYGETNYTVIADQTPARPTSP